ncbi:AI-2E family transporter [bacterium]|nr:AI-2E family transporter [bacterium]
MIKSLSFKDITIVSLLAGTIVLFFYGLDKALLPLTFAWLLAYATLPLVKKMATKGIARSQASILVLATVFISLILLGVLILPPLISDLEAAVLEVPKNVSIVLEKLDTFFSNYGFHIPYDKQSLIDFASQYSEKISGNLIKSVGDILTNSIVNAASIIVILLNLFLIPIFFIYVINDYEKLIDTFESLVPVSWRPKLDEILQQSNLILSGYIRGQLLVCAILGVLYSLGLLIVGVKFAVIIGFMTGFLSIIPYVGFSFGLTAALITALANFEGFSPLVGILVVYGIVQMLESFVITPRIVGNKVGLSSFEAILALIVLGNLLGFVGLFLAIPVGAITKLLINHLLVEYKKTAFYKTY